MWEDSCLGKKGRGLRGQRTGFAQRHLFLSLEDSQQLCLRMGCLGEKSPRAPKAHIHDILIAFAHCSLI